MSKKIRVTSKLIEKVEKVFAKGEKPTICTGDGLDRHELRALEREGIVRKVPTYERFRYGGSTMSYIWKFNKRF